MAQGATHIGMTGSVSLVDVMPIELLKKEENPQPAELSGVPDLSGDFIGRQSATTCQRAVSVLDYRPIYSIGWLAYCGQNSPHPTQTARSGPPGGPCIAWGGSGHRDRLPASAAGARSGARLFLLNIWIGAGRYG